MSNKELDSLETPASPEPAADQRKFKVAIIAPTCRYYQVPLFKELAADPRIDLTVYFCSQEALHSEDVSKQFRTSGSWGVEEQLLGGYKHKFLKNFSPRPSYLRAGYGLINFEIWGEIRREKPDAVVLMAWVNPTWWIAILACMVYKVPFLYLTDANVQSEVLKKNWKLTVKKFILGKVLFPLTSGFLCSGTANRKLYNYYGVPDEKLVPFAYSWGHEPLLDFAYELEGKRDQLRKELNIEHDSCVFLFCGRLHEEKNPFGLLKAFQQVKAPNKTLIFVGDGMLLSELREYVATHRIESVYFYGFQDRNQISKYYASSDVLVLPSYRESWGIVVNEAMCFGLPIVVSDQVGAGDDLVLPGYNGYHFPEGDTEALTDRLQELLDLPRDLRVAMGTRSLDLIRKWTERDLGETLVSYLDASTT